MTLREKFKNIELDEPYIFISEQDATECEKITDELAIGFLHWYLNNDDIKKFSYSYENLLITYKKEIGL